MTDNDNYVVDGAGRRWFLKQSTALAGTLLLPPLTMQASTHPAAAPDATTTARSITLRINRKTYKLTAEPRETLLDLMRDRLNLTGSKKGCDHGQCGACTVHI